MVYLVSIDTSKYSSYDEDDDDLFLWYGWPPKGFEPAQNLSSSFVEWSGAVRITTTPRRHKILSYIPKSEGIYYTKKNEALKLETYSTQVDTKLIAWMLFSIVWNLWRVMSEKTVLYLPEYFLTPILTPSFSCI